MTFSYIFQALVILVCELGISRSDLVQLEPSPGSLTPVGSLIKLQCSSEEDQCQWSSEKRLTYPDDLLSLLTPASVVNPSLTDFRLLILDSSPYAWTIICWCENADKMNQTLGHLTLTPGYLDLNLPTAGSVVAQGSSISLMCMSGPAVCQDEVKRLDFSAWSYKLESQPSAINASLTAFNLTALRSIDQNREFACWCLDRNGQMKYLGFQTLDLGDLNIEPMTESSNDAVAVGSSIALFCSSAPGLCQDNSTVLSFPESVFRLTFPPNVVNETLTVFNLTAISTSRRQLMICQCTRRDDAARQVLGVQVLKVGFAPEKVSGFSCISNSLKDVQCQWQPAKDPSVTFEVCYLMNSWDDAERRCANGLQYRNFGPCVSTSPTSCSVNAEPSINPVVKLFVFTINEFGTSVYTYVMKASNFSSGFLAFVKLATPVVEVTKVGYEEIELTWIPECTSHVSIWCRTPGLEYEIQLNAMEDVVEDGVEDRVEDGVADGVEEGAVEAVEGLVSSNNPIVYRGTLIKQESEDSEPQIIVIGQLLPGTAYQGQMKVKFLDTGVWSEPNMLPVTTLVQVISTEPSISSNELISVYGMLEFATAERGTVEKDKVIIGLSVLVAVAVVLVVLVVALFYLRNYKEADVKSESTTPTNAVDSTKDVPQYLSTTTGSMKADDVYPVISDTDGRKALNITQNSCIRSLTQGYQTQTNLKPISI